MILLTPGPALHSLVEQSDEQLVEPAHHPQIVVIGRRSRTVEVFRAFDTIS